MKKVLFTFALLIFFLTSCNDMLEREFPRHMRIVSVVGDDSDPHRLPPQLEDAERVYDFNDDNKYWAYQFRYRDVSNVSASEIISEKISWEYELFSNNEERTASIKSYKETIKSVFVRRKARYGGSKNRSRVLATLTDEAVSLMRAGDKNTERTMLVYSDCLDNSEFNFYNPQVLDAAVNSPQVILDHMDAMYKVPPLSNLNIIIIFQTDDPVVDRHHEIAASIIKKFYEGKGAKVQVVPNMSAAQL